MWCRALEISIPAEVCQGSRRDAILHSVGANSDHGLRRTSKDKRRSEETLLRDDEWSGWSNMESARRAAVSESFVRKLRDSHFAQNEVKPEPRTYTTKHGTTATMNTKRIGRSPGQPETPLLTFGWPSYRHPPGDAEGPTSLSRCDRLRIAARPRDRKLCATR